LLSAGVTCGIFSLVSDVMVQQFEGKPNKKDANGSSGDNVFDVARAARMTTFGLLLYGPLQHVWYVYLDRTFGKKNYVPHFLAKLGLNQTVLGPVVLLSVFAWNFVLEGKAGELQAKVKDDFWPTLITGWKIWIPLASINFWLIPVNKQVLYMSACSTISTGWLSYASNRSIGNLLTRKRSS